MNYKRLRKAKLLAKKRFKYWYYDYNPEDPVWERFSKADVLGSLRKTNVVCSCQDCCNPRHSYHYNNQEKLTIQERKAPQINEIWE